MASRALPDLVARIRVDSTGVDAAAQSLIGSFGKANLALAGLAAGLGILITGSKSMLDSWREQEKAANDLGQAVKVYGGNLAETQEFLTVFIETNSSYITSQAEVVDGYAKLTRSGLDAKETQRVLNDAVDLAAIKHISLTEAVDVLNAAEHGRLRGLIDLGITTAKYTDANGNLIKSQRNVQQSMNDVDKRLKGGRDTLDSVDQASNRLNNHWQDLSRKGGPVIETLLDTIVTKLNDAYDALDRIGKDDALWARISDRLTTIARWLHDNFFQPIIDFLEWLDAWSGGRPASSNAPAPLPGAPGGPPATGRNRASGGPVVPGGIYTVGEHGPETLVMGARGGIVIPHGSSGGGMTVNVFGYVGDNRQLALVIRESLRRLDREQR